MARDARDLDAMLNIATFHREHERYYTMSQLELSADLLREANRLKIVADVWLRQSDEASAPGVDYADPRFQAAGCSDLNAVPAIAAIGVLFMEGEGEPAEIRALKAKLMGISMGLTGAGQWLADKMESAWERESVLLTPELVDAALTRFQTIVTNVRGSREMTLVGKLLGVAVDCLGRIDFTPAAVRADRALAGKMLRTAGGVVDMAGRILARSAADLGENDVRWTEYQDVLRRVREQAS